MKERILIIFNKKEIILSKEALFNKKVVTFSKEKVMLDRKEEV